MLLPIAEMMCDVKKQRRSGRYASSIAIGRRNRPLRKSLLVVVVFLRAILVGGGHAILFAKPAAQVDLAAPRRTEGVVRPLLILAGHVPFADRTPHLIHRPPSPQTSGFFRSSLFPRTVRVYGFLSWGRLPACPTSPG